MRAMVLTQSSDVGRNPLALQDVPAPDPGRDEVRMRVHVCGVCRTDLHVVEGDLPPSKRPLIPGHEVVGVVDRVGTRVRTVKEGDRIGIAWLRDTCGQCEFCRSGRENLCERAQFTGYQWDGGYAEYAVVPAAFAYPIPPLFNDGEAAPLLCAGIIGFRALRLSQVKPGGMREVIVTTIGIPAGIIAADTPASNSTSQTWSNPAKTSVCMDSERRLTSRFRSRSIGAARSLCVRFARSTGSSRAIWAQHGWAAPMSSRPRSCMGPSCSLRSGNSSRRRFAHFEEGARWP